MTVYYRHNRHQTPGQRAKKDARLQLTSYLVAGILISLLLSPLAQAAGQGVPLFRYQEQGVNLPAGTAQADELELGETQFFWAYAQGFFTGYYALSATCQAIGENAYLVTEDAYINDLACSPLADSLTLFAASASGLHKSIDGGLTWDPCNPGLPDADGVFDDFDSTNYNHRAEVYCVFSRAEYGAAFDEVWVGTEFGPFWSTAAGDTFQLRAQSMATHSDPEIDDKPATYDILGHPDELEVYWAATIDGVYMTRNANRWRSLAHGMPPGEGSVWDNNATYAIDYENEMLFTTCDKGVFYGTPRPLGTSSSSNIVTSWLPLGGYATFKIDSTHIDSSGAEWVYGANEDTLFLVVEPTTSLGFTIDAGQNVTFVDPDNGIFWAGFIDVAGTDLITYLTEENLFYYPEGSSTPEYDYRDINLEDLVAYGYNPATGPALLAEPESDALTIWVGLLDGGIYSHYFEDGLGMTYDPAGSVETISHEDYHVLQIKKQADLYYIATDMGLFTATDPHGDWDRQTGYVYNSTMTDSMAVHTAAVTFGADERIYAGGDMGGFLVQASSADEFVSSNQGMMHLNGTPQQCAMFNHEFDEATPASDTTGIYATACQWWGDLPVASSAADIDGDDKILILFCNIDDEYYLETGDGTFINGYFDGSNENALTYLAHSNQREMFYLDNDPQWINQATSAACLQMFNLINWNYDFGEERWLREAMSIFTQDVAGYDVIDGTVSLAQQNTLNSWGDATSTVEYEYLFMFMLYLYEQPDLFPDLDGGSGVVHTIREIAESDYRGVAGLGRLIYEKWHGTSEDGVDYTSTFAEVYDRFIIAASLDISDENFYDGMYGFTAINSSISPLKRRWYFYVASTGEVNAPPYYFHIPFWSMRAVNVDDDDQFFNPGTSNENIIDEIVLNGDDRNQIHHYLLYALADNFQPEMSGDDVVIIPVETDDLKQKAVVTIPPELVLDGTTAYPNSVRIISICSSESADGPACYVLGDDSSPPENIYMTVTQNPIDDHFLDIYSFSDERILPDGGQLYRVEDLGLIDLEGPLVDIMGGVWNTTKVDTTFTLDQNVFFSNPDAATYSYHIAHELAGIEFPADLVFSAYGEDIMGNEKSSDDLSVTVDQIESAAGGSIAHTVSGASVSIPPDALRKDALIMISASDAPQAMVSQGSSRQITGELDDGHHAVGPLVSIGSPGLDLDRAIEVVIPFDAALVADSEIGIYRAEAGGWTYIGGNAAINGEYLSASSWKFGQFRVLAGPLGDIKAEIPLTFALEQNYPNPFNPSTQIQFEITRTQWVKFDVYNIAGQRVATLANRSFDAGRHELHWQADALSSGVYFLRMKAEEGTLHRKMMLLK